MSADPRTDPPTPDPLTPEDWLTPLEDAAVTMPGDGPQHRRCVACGFVVWPRGGHQRECRVAGYLAALPSAPDQRLRELTDFIDGVISVTPHLDGSDYAAGASEGIHTALRTMREKVAALSEATTSPEATLDVAWREAEAALPEGWHIANLVTDGPRNPGWWVEARAGMLRRASDVTATGPTPAAALHALAARLRGPA